MGKIREIVEEYDNFVKHYMMAYAEDKEMSISAIIEKTKEVLDALGKLRINKVTMNRLIETSLGIMGKTKTELQYNEAVKYIRKTFNLLYHANKEMFLQNFIKRN